MTSSFFSALRLPAFWSLLPRFLHPRALLPRLHLPRALLSKTGDSLRLRPFARLLILALFVLPACSPGQVERRAALGGKGGGGKGGGGTMEAYVDAVALKAAGNCKRSEPTLEVFARQGGGFEVAQFHLGDCLTRRAFEAKPPEREILLGQGIYWLTLAARSKDAKAQARLIEIYMDREAGTFSGVEAGSWYLIFDDNINRTFLETVTLKPGLEERLHAELSDADWQEAREALKAYEPLVQEVRAGAIPFAGSSERKRSGTGGRDGNRGGGGGRRGDGRKGGAV